MSTSDNTIISFETPANLQDLAMGEKNSAPDAGSRIDQQQFHIRMVNSQKKREKASLLIKKMYAWRGYEVDTSTSHPVNKIMLVAETEGMTVGTMSLCFDGGIDDIGLPADDNFRDELNKLRQQGRRLCEPSRLAIDKGVSKRVFAALIHISYIYAHNIHGYTDYVIEVNPRHVMFYKRMLGFLDFGSVRHCSRVDAMAVLLRLDLDYMKKQIKIFGGMMELNNSDRSFYPYFFPLVDEIGITSRLCQGKE